MEMGLYFEMLCLSPILNRGFISVYIARNVAGSKYGNAVRDTAYPAALGNGEMEQW